MKPDGAFVKRMAYASAAIAAVGAYPLAVHAGGAVVTAAIVGFVIAAANVVAGYSAIVYGMQKSPKMLNAIVLGSMVIRMALILLLLWIFIVPLALPAVPLAAALFGSYFVFMIVEIYSLRKRAGNNRIA